MMSKKMATKKMTEQNSHFSIGKWLVSFGFMAAVFMLGYLNIEPLKSFVSTTIQNYNSGNINSEQMVERSNSEQSDKWKVVFNHDVHFSSAIELEEFVNQYITESFFALNIEDATKTIGLYPWIKSVEVRKVWPNILLLEIEEHQPWLLLNGTQIVSNEGVVFTPNDVSAFSTLPKLNGQFGSISDLLSMYDYFLNSLESDGFSLKSLAYQPLSGWMLELDSGTQVLVGKNNIQERLERFQNMLDGAKSINANEVAYFDLRYRTGIAVGWNEKKSEQIAAR